MDKKPTKMRLDKRITWKCISIAFRRYFEGKIRKSKQDQGSGYILADYTAHTTATMMTSLFIKNIPNQTTTAKEMIQQQLKLQFPQVMGSDLIG